MLLFLIGLLLGGNESNLPGNQALQIKPTGPEKVYTSDNLAEFSSAKAVICKEYGFEKLVTRSYESDYGQINEQVYQMKDFKAAFGLYSYFKDLRAKLLPLGDGGYSYDHEIAFWQNKFFVRITDQSKTKAASPIMIRRARQLSDQIGTRHARPALVNYLPETGLIKRSIKYFLGPEALSRYYSIQPDDVFGFKDEAEAIVADYVLSKQGGKLVLLGFPDHPLAIHHLKTITPALEQKKPELGIVRIKRAGVIIAILIGNFNRDTADKILHEINYADTIRWIYDRRNQEPTRGANSGTLLLLGTVVNSFLLTGILFVITFVTALIIGSINFKTSYFGRLKEHAVITLNIYKR